MQEEEDCTWPSAPLNEPLRAMGSGIVISSKDSSFSVGTTQLYIHIYILFYCICILDIYTCMIIFPNFLFFFNIR